MMAAQMVRGSVSGDSEQQPMEMPPWMSEIMARWLRDFNFEGDELPNCLSLHQYPADFSSPFALVSQAENGAGIVGATSEEPARLVSVSLGRACLFEAEERAELLDPSQGTESESDRGELLLLHGDICAMEGCFARDFVHKEQEQALDAAPLDNTPRIQATLRWIT